MVERLVGFRQLPNQDQCTHMTSIPLAPTPIMSPMNPQLQAYHPHHNPPGPQFFNQ